ncbi:D-alanyl-D-alanine carboxypeptidase family protein [Acidocella sp.]|uniref:D-alanyl-D-alanine carboxypeptidase family protein n=1 Tax=Acidocella sp. TaxID=50710 RepID=UPI002603F09D|nr:D-alanyl-D-alanine carboxypeptidase family protein [Acidocella sp.]MDD2795227.1 D-alanyl-D-alanine carboxypeptidase [Acidocella sp.]
MKKSTGISLMVLSLAMGAAPALAKTPHYGAHAAAPNAQNKDTATAAASGPPPVPDSPIADKNTPTPPTLPQATAYVLMDAATGAILAEAAPNLQVAPASLTKLMTAHIAYQALHDGSLKMDQVVPVSAAAWHAGGSTMFIDTTSTVTVDQLLHGLIIVSGNDAAVALAEQIAGTQGAFVQIMNKDAAAMGMTNTVFTNVDGLPDPAEHTSALDVAILSRNIIKDEPEFLNISKEQSYTYNGITQASWNPVLAHDPTVDGMKTGLTDASGHCIDATALRGNMRLIAAVMGGPTWAASTAAIEALLDYGQKFFTDEQIATAGQQVATLASGALNTGTVPVGPGKDITLTLPSDAAARITHNIAYTADLTPGTTKGETLGIITYTLDGKTLTTAPAIALADEAPASFVTKLKRKLSKYI